MTYMNFTHMEPKQPGREGRRLSLRATAKVLLKGYHVAAAAPAFDKLGILGYMAKVNKSLDPEGVASGRSSEERRDLLQLSGIPHNVEDFLVERVLPVVEKFLARRAEKKNK